MTTEGEKQAARRKAMALMQAAAVLFADPNKPGYAAQLDVETVDGAWPAIGRYHLFSINYPASWLAELWLWLSVRCWKLGKRAREDLPDPREGLPKVTRGLVMDQVGEVSQGQWSPAQAATIRKALAGEMPLPLWQMQNSWRSAMAQGQGDNPETGKVLVSDTPLSPKVRTTERGEPPEPGAPQEGPAILVGEPPKRKKRIKVTVRKRKARS
jgi:hypothetical protein